MKYSQLVYETYEACWNSNTHMYMSPWSDLSSKEKQAWEDSAVAVIEEYRRVNQHSGSWIIDDGET